MPSSSTTLGAHHVGLTVPNLEETKRFFVDFLGFDQVGDAPDYPAVFLSDGTLVLTLWQVMGDPETAVQFDRKNVIGLHHLALKVADKTALRDLYARLKQSDTDIVFGPEPLGDGQAEHMMCHIPSGIRIEFIALPS